MLERSFCAEEAAADLLIGYIVDATRKLLCPGFNDAHLHFVTGGMQLDSVQLTDATRKKTLRAAPQLVISRVHQRGPTSRSVSQVFRADTEETILGYYTSAEGLKELSYKGNTYHGQCPGCTMNEGAS